jgi:morphogenetic protein associated with SpoVID
MPPFVQPIIGIPCGWMPIYDADCYPFMHTGQIQAMPRPQVPQPMPSTQFPMHQQESPIFSGQGPATHELESALIEGWKLIESPEFMFEEPTDIATQPSAVCPPEQVVSPEIMFEESPEFDLQPCPPLQGYIPQAISPAVQGEWNPAQFGYPPMQHPGCGCNGEQHQQPYFQHPPMMVPLFYGQPCGCPSCMQRASHQGMPSPYQGGPNWYGAY